jgi:hypothetical protein
VGLNCRQLHDYVALPLIPIVSEVGLRGLPIDMGRRNGLIEALTVRVGSCDARLRAAGVANPGSSQATQASLRALGIPLTTRTESGEQFKTDLEVLGRLNYQFNTKRIADGKAARFPFLGDLVRRRKLEKAISNLQALEPCHDGMLRTRLQAIATTTARYASAGFGTRQKPGYCPVCLVWGRHGTNLQNIPKETPELNVKSVFVAARGWRLGELDYKALELFIQGYRTNGKLLDRLSNDPDPHTYHAARFYAADWEGCDKPLRKKRRGTLKNVIYGMRGGGGDRALQMALAKKDEYFDLAEMAEFRRFIEGEYPEMPLWIRATDEMLVGQLKRGERRIIRNGFGRPRVLLGRDPLKEALATEISGTAAEIMNFVLLRMAVYHPDEFRYIVLQIHDSFLVYAPNAVFPRVMAVVREEMQRACWLWGRFVSFTCEPKAGECWAEMEEWRDAA